MKIIIFLLLISSYVCAQTYLDITYNNDDPLNSTDLSLISKITFNEADINFLLDDNLNVSKPLTIISKITLSGDNGGNPLPVELITFTAIVIAEDVTLNWSTASELNNSGFEVQRTTSLNRSQQNWTKIGFVNGRGNSITPTDYSFTDKPKNENTYYYRLKQIDFNGKYEFSNIVSVEINTLNQYTLNQNYPNPFNPTTTIEFYIPYTARVMVNIFDVTGQMINRIFNDFLEVGHHSTIWNAKNQFGQTVASGTYIYQVKFDNKIISKKMLFIK